MSAAEDWQVALEALAVPKEILEEAPDSPWTLPIEPFRQRAQAVLAGESSPSLDKAMEALPEGGVVIDVGVGVGAASLPLHPRASLLVGVDTSQEIVSPSPVLGCPRSHPLAFKHRARNERSCRGHVDYTRQPSNTPT